MKSHRFPSILALVLALLPASIAVAADHELSAEEILSEYVADFRLDPAFRFATISHPHP